MKSDGNLVRSGTIGFEEVEWAPFWHKAVKKRAPNCNLGQLNLLEKSGKMVNSVPRGPAKKFEKLLLAEEKRRV